MHFSLLWHLQCKAVSQETKNHLKYSNWIQNNSHGFLLCYPSIRLLILDARTWSFNHIHNLCITNYLCNLYHLEDAYQLRPLTNETHHEESSKHPEDLLHPAPTKKAVRVKGALAQNNATGCLHGESWDSPSSQCQFQSLKQMND